MLSNRQIFENIVNQVVFSTQQMPSAHSVADLSRMTGSMPMLMIAWVLFCLITIRAFCYQRMK